MELLDLLLDLCCVLLTGPDLGADLGVDPEEVNITSLRPERATPAEELPRDRGDGEAPEGRAVPEEGLSELGASSRDETRGDARGPPACCLSRWVKIPAASYRIG